MSHSTDLELRLHLAVLRRRIRSSGRTFRELEDELGWVRGALTAMARSSETLRFEDVFEILAALGVEPADFFEEIAVESAKRSAARRPQDGSGCFRRLVSTLRRWSSGCD